MPLKMNCKQNDQGVWCKDKRVKRSLFGMGARMCCRAEGKFCPFQDKIPRPPPPVQRPPSVHHGVDLCQE